MTDGTNQLAVYCLKELYSSLKERMTEHPPATSTGRLEEETVSVSKEDPDWDRGADVGTRQKDRKWLRRMAFTLVVSQEESPKTDQS